MSNKDNIREIILIGRDRDCNFICDDTSVSRHHAQIVDYGTSCSVVDLDSTNGTTVNGRKVSSETTLHAGDLLRVGNVDIPWQQLVQPPQEPESNKKLLWILMPIIAALLIGGGLVVYFVYGHAKDKDEKLEKKQSELVGELAQYITENEEQARVAKENADSIISASQRRIDSVKRMAVEVERDANEKVKISEQRASEAERRSTEAEQRITEAEQRSAEAEQRITEAEQKTAEAEQKTAEAEQKTVEAEEKLEQANQTLELAESIKQEPIMAAIESLNDEDIKAICRALKIEFNVRLSAKDALKKEFLTSGDNRKQEIAIAIRQKQKSSNNDKK